MIKLLALILAIVPQIIPAPAEMQVREGCFQVDGDKHMEFVLNPSAKIPAEGYTLDVTRTRVKAVASTPAGLFYARQTLAQLEQDGSIPCVKIKDYPRFHWRGLMIDCSRHFMSVEQIKQHIDILSQYKINTLHWHLTDDQGWRIEIKKYPRLIEVGSKRTEFDGTVTEGYYTQEQVKEVVAYAAERFVTVVPEIEMPGHSFAAVRSYPELSCEKKPVNNFYTWGSPDIVLCPGSEFTFQFLEDVIAEVAPLFPGKYIHIGGDECKKVRWEKCPACQARIKAQGLVADEHGTAEEKLQSYAVKRMEGILAKFGKSLVGWDEILEGGLSPNATVMSWRGEKGGIQAAREGHDVVMTPGSGGLYLNHYQGDPKAEPEGYAHHSILQVPYDYNPVPAELTAEEAKHILGVQGNLWGEFLYTDYMRDYLTFPKMFAVAETGWTPLEKKDFPDFCRRLDAACQRLDALGVAYHIPLPEQPGGSISQIAFRDSTVLTFTTSRPMDMVYTLDGSKPTAASARYEGPIVVKKSGMFRIASITSYGKLSAERTISLEKMEPIDALQPENLTGKLTVRTTPGAFIIPHDIPLNAVWTQSELTDIRKIPKLFPFDGNMQDPQFFAAEAEGYFKVPSTGTWYFSSVYDEVWIDGRLVVDNRGEIKKNFRHDGSLVLRKGIHHVKVVFLSNVNGGWTTARNKGEVLLRRSPEDKWVNIEIK
ncbi:MAG: family 20 glycosylhydrolase [Bacteroidales bacterium]|nr:family 20 glycosylhydrolase [Bacteroidales bacterium]